MQAMHQYHKSLKIILIKREKLSKPWSSFYCLDRHVSFLPFVSTPIPLHPVGLENTNAHPSLDKSCENDNRFRALSRTDDIAV